MIDLVLFAVGLMLLVGGAELLVGGASRLAAAVGISPLVVGLTVVACGTSAPELAVGVQASWSGRADLAVGNVVGSNICNVLLILGLAALVAPLTVHLQLIRSEVPLMIAASLLLWLLAADLRIGRWDGLLLLASGVAYVVFTVRRSRQQTRSLTPSSPTPSSTAPHASALHRPSPQASLAAGDADRRSGNAEQQPVVLSSGLQDSSSFEGSAGFQNPAERLGGRLVFIQIAMILSGLGMLVLGAHWMVAGAVTLARLVGLSELIIGLTVVAVGTSLPEIATSLLASLRGARDIAVGNAVGSNLFNILVVLGATATVAPHGVAVSPSALGLDIPVMAAVALACLPIFFTGQRIERWEGMLFLGYYAAYTAYLILAARQHASLGMFSAVMLWFVIPLTTVTLIVLVIRWSRRVRQGDPQAA